MAHPIESLMRKLEEKRREERIAALTEKTSPLVMWKVTAQPKACPRCREFAEYLYAEKPEPPHPHCKCRIEQKEKAPQKDNSQKRYYVIGRRPLSAFAHSSSQVNSYPFKLDKNKDNKIYKDGTRKNTIPLHPEHQHFFDSDGNNFGFFNDSYVHSDSASSLRTYIFGDVKYDAEIIDEAVVKYEQDKYILKEMLKDFSSDPLYEVPDFDPTKYQLINNNCQDYIREVLKHARDIAQKKHKPLIIP